MKEIILSKASGSDELRRYFMAVLEVSKSGKEFPINLDEVWPLVYGKKSDAVEALCKNFMQDVDYQVLRQNPQNPNGGRPSNVYMLTVPCMEFFIARKVRAVFDVYRQVFHGVATGTAQLAMPKDYPSALRALADQVEVNQQLQIQNAEQQEQVASPQRQNKQITAQNVKKVKNVWSVAKKLLPLQCSIIQVGDG